MGTSLENITFLRNLETVELMEDLDPEMVQRKEITNYICGIEGIKRFPECDIRLVHNSLSAQNLL